MSFIRLFKILKPTKYPVQILFSEHITNQFITNQPARFFLLHYLYGFCNFKNQNIPVMRFRDYICS